MSKTKTVMVDKVGVISYPENFITANNIAQTTLIDGNNSTFQSAVAGAITQIGATGELSKISVPSVEAYQIVNRDYPTSGGIWISDPRSSGRGITITENNPLFVDQIFGRASYENDSDAYYCIALGIDGINIGHNTHSNLLHISTDGITVSDNATVQLPANTTIGGNTPAVFGSNVDGSLNKLTVQKISNSDNNSDIPLEINAQIINLATTDCVWFNGGSISVDPKTSSFGIADYSNILKLNRADEGWITVDGTLSLYKDKIQYSSGTNVPYISFSNKNIKLYSFDENLWSESSFTLATDKIEINVGQGDINLGVGVGSINIDSGNGLYMAGEAEIKIESDNQVIINAGNDIKIGTVNDYSDTHSIIFGSKFSVPVYTENTDGTYTKTNKIVSLRVVERDDAYTIVID